MKLTCNRKMKNKFYFEDILIEIIILQKKIYNKQLTIGKDQEIETHFFQKQARIITGTRGDSLSIPFSI